MHIKRIRDLQDELKRVKKDERVLQHEQNRQADRERNLDMPDRHNRWIPNILRNDEVQDMVCLYVYMWVSTCTYSVPVCVCLSAGYVFMLRMYIYVSVT